MERMSDSEISRTIFSVAMAIVLSGVLLVALGCTRAVDQTPEVKLSVPTSSHSSMSGTERLGTVIINLRKASQPQASPKVYEFEFRESQTPVVPGQSLTLTINKDVPRESDLLIQYLGVFESENGIIRFSYGDTVVSTASGGVVNANIAASMFGSSSQEAKVAGRYLHSASEGPTGTMVAYFQPPNNRPKMSVTKRDIINGWFHIFVLSGEQAKMTYVMEDTGEVVFDQVHLNHSMLNVSSDYFRAKFSQPQAYTGGDGSDRVMPPTQYIVGYFLKEGLSSSLLSGKKTCYHTFEQAIPNVFTDATLSSPLIYKGASGGAMDLYRVGGGYVASYGAFYTDSSCDNTSTESIRFYPHRIHTGDDGEIIGMNGPFLIQNDFASHGGYFNVTNEGDAVTFSWKYLPGITSSHVTGVSILAKYDPSHNHYNTHRITCEELSSLGFEKAGDSTTTSFTYQISPSTYYYDYQFVACPYRVTSSGIKYFSPVRIDSGSSYDAIQSWGWGAQSSSTPPGGSFTDISGAYAKITSVDTTASNYTVLNYGASQGSFMPGKEIMLIVMSQGNDPSSCGTVDGFEIRTGHFEFTRIFDVNANSIKIPKGSFVENIPSGNIALGEYPDLSHCVVQIVQVPHFKDFEVNANGLNASDFSYPAGGGIIALRVNGTLTLNGSISASSRGYGGGYSADYWGGGVHGVEGPQNTGSGGQPGGSAAGGGAGYGVGSPGTDGVTLGGSPHHNGGYEYQLIAGGGGGSMNGSTGGKGGGIIFIAARKIMVGVGAIIQANGETVTNGGGGGGGGGSITIYNHIFGADGSNQLSLTALGGDKNSYGGAGGGGFIRFNTCLDPTALISTISNSAGFGATALGSDGNTNYFPDFDTGNIPYYCHYY